VTTETVLFRATDQPTDLAPRRARGSMLRPMSALDQRAWGAALSHSLSRPADKGGAAQPEFERDLHQGLYQACRTAVTHDHHPVGPQEFRRHHCSHTIPTHIVVQFEVMRSLATPRPSDAARWGGRGSPRKICRSPIFLSSVRRLLRQRCDARGFKLLPIEIIAQRRVAPAFEPQKLSWMDGLARRDRNPHE
jgi:hypothetical protein